MEFAVNRHGKHGKSMIALINAVATHIVRATISVVLLLQISCSHTILLESIPTDSAVYLMDKSGGKAKLLGRTPLSTEEVTALSTSGVVVEAQGHVPMSLVVPFQNSTVSKISVKLIPYDEKFIQSLPFDVHKKVVDQMAGELIDLQQTLYGGTKEEAEKAIVEAEKRLERSSRFHQIVGSYRFYQGMFEQAVRSLSRAMELDPQNETARRMLVLTDVKVANSTQSVRNKAYANLNAAAVEVANLGNGYLVRTKSTPTQSDYDGFEIVIPTDVLFKPYSGKFKNEGLAVLARLADELRKNDHPRSILVEGHTGSDMYAELRNMPAHSAGSAKLQGAWEVSSERAGAVVTYLKSEGVGASNWSIAGYGDSRPLVLPEKIDKNSLKIDLESLSRRVVIKVVLHKQNQKIDVIEASDAKKIQERLNKILPKDEEEDNPVPQTRVNKNKSSSNDVSPPRVNTRTEPPEPKEDIPRRLPNKTILQKRAEQRRDSSSGGGETSMRARSLNPVIQEERKVEQPVSRSEKRRARERKTREQLNDVTRAPPLPSVPKLMPQD
jgi:outer membrane protein OmpA-like peptidoglycan-associated protein